MEQARNRKAVLFGKALAVFAAVAFALCLSAAYPQSQAHAADGDTQAMHRLYNPNSGEHFYTASAAERDYLVKEGWNYEDVAWTAPVKSNTPVYRLYNSNEPLGDHHYTTSKSEYDYLVSIGWTGENIGWYSDDAKGVALLRLYNPNAYPSGKTGAHHYTANQGEHDNLVGLGWQDEKIGWYGVDTTKKAEPAVEQFTVKFVDADGKEISSAKYDKGTKASAVKVPADPTKAADATNTYVFAGWDPEVADVTKDATYKATFTAVPKADVKTDSGVAAAGGIFDNKPAGAASLELVVEPASDADKAEAAETYATEIGANEVKGVYEVDLLQHNTDGTTKELTEGVGALKLTFPVEAEDGTAAKVIQLHENDSNTPEVITHDDLTVADRKVEVTLQQGKLSTFIVTVSVPEYKLINGASEKGNLVFNIGSFSPYNDSVATAKAGDTVYFEATAKEGWAVDPDGALTATWADSEKSPIEVSKVQGAYSGRRGYFTMPAGDVTVNATYIQEEVGDYTITIDDTIEGGTISANRTKFSDGDEIVVTAVPEDGYKLSDIKLLDPKTSEELSDAQYAASIEIEGNTAIITIGEYDWSAYGLEDVKISAVFELETPASTTQALTLKLTNEDIDIYNCTVALKKGSAEGEAVNGTYNYNDGDSYYAFTLDKGATYYLSVSKSGYETATDTIAVAADAPDTATKTVTLTKQTAEITLVKTGAGEIELLGYNSISGVSYADGAKLEPATNGKVNVANYSYVVLCAKSGSITSATWATLKSSGDWVTKQSWIPSDLTSHGAYGYLSSASTEAAGGITLTVATEAAAASSYALSFSMTSPGSASAKWDNTKVGDTVSAQGTSLSYTKNGDTPSSPNDGEMKYQLMYKAESSDTWLGMGTAVSAERNDKKQYGNDKFKMQQVSATVPELDAGAYDVKLTATWTIDGQNIIADSPFAWKMTVTESAPTTYTVKVTAAKGTDTLDSAANIVLVNQ